MYQTQFLHQTSPPLPSFLDRAILAILHHTCYGRTGLLFVLPSQQHITDHWRWRWLVMSLCTYVPAVPVTLEGPGDWHRLRAGGWHSMWGCREQRMNSSLFPLEGLFWNAKVQMPMLRLTPARASSYICNSSMGTVALLAVFSILVFCLPPLLGFALQWSVGTYDFFRICFLGNPDKD